MTLPERLAHGEGVEEFLETYGGKMRRLCCRILRNDADAEDAWALAVWACVSHVSQYGSRSAFSTWVYAVTKNEAIRYRRWLASRRLIPGLVPDTPVDGVSARAELRETLNRLSSAERQLVEYALLGESLRTLIPGAPGTARTRLCRTLAKLRRT